MAAQAATDASGIIRGHQGQLKHPSGPGMHGLDPGFALLPAPADAFRARLQTAAEAPQRAPADQADGFTRRRSSSSFDQHISLRPYPDGDAGPFPVIAGDRGQKPRGGRVRARARHSRPQSGRLDHCRRSLFGYSPAARRCRRGLSRCAAVAPRAAYPPGARRRSGFS